MRLLPGVPTEEDDYDVDTDDYDAPASTTPPSVTAPSLPPPQPPGSAAGAPASAQAALVLAPPSLPMLQARTSLPYPPPPACLPPALCPSITVESVKGQLLFFCYSICLWN